jgi:hypothetical protein
MDNKMITEKSWDEFRESGLAWWINSILHVFGWALVFNVDNGKVIDCYPARVKFRGWDEESQEIGFRRISKFLKDNIDELKKEADD